MAVTERFRVKIKINGGGKQKALRKRYIGRKIE